jgi:hypothetical protein
MEALEAGTAPLTGVVRSRSHDSGSGESEGVLKQSLSWLDQGLGMVDEAVGKIATGLAKWTDDEGGDEGLLLPMSREQRSGRR